jgi:hypothetical protein
MRTRIEHVEVDPPIAASGSLDDANALYTSESTLVETPADAVDIFLFI